jgi:hypothetical protein
LYYFNADITTIPDDNRIAYIFEVDHEYHNDLNHRDLPLVPENKCPPESNQTKKSTYSTMWLLRNI